MEAFVEAGFKGSNLTALNKCQLYLQVIMVADIVTGNGERILDSAWEGVYDSF
jgi:hypothetical protein